MTVVVFASDVEDEYFEAGGQGSLFDRLARLVWRIDIRVNGRSTWKLPLLSCQVEG
jgi:hypothetical protein